MKKGWVEGKAEWDTQKRGGRRVRKNRDGGIREMVNGGGANTR